MVCVRGMSEKDVKKKIPFTLIIEINQVRRKGGKIFIVETERFKDKCYHIFHKLKEILHGWNFRV